MATQATPPTVAGAVPLAMTTRLCALALGVGVVAGAAAYGYVALQHEVTHWLWHVLPGYAGFTEAPWIHKRGDTFYFFFSRRSRSCRIHASRPCCVGGHSGGDADSRWQARRSGCAHPRGGPKLESRRVVAVVWQALDGT